MDGLRAVAVGLVIITHAAYLTGFVNSGGFWGVLLGRGDFGVALFTLSAICSTSASCAPPASGSTSAPICLRWAARVLPAYWVVLLVVCVAARPDARDGCCTRWRCKSMRPVRRSLDFSPPGHRHRTLLLCGAPIAAALHRVATECHAPLTLLAALFPLAFGLHLAGNLVVTLRVDTPYESAAARSRELPHPA